LAEAFEGEQAVARHFAVAAAVQGIQSAVAAVAEAAGIRWAAAAGSLGTAVAGSEEGSQSLEAEDRQQGSRCIAVGGAAAVAAAVGRSQLAAAIGKAMAGPGSPSAEAVGVRGGRCWRRPGMSWIRRTCCVFFRLPARMHLSC
jgi:hypothetical protein